jgi:glycosyltransferase involved in cell wall biosynthesis
MKPYHTASAPTAIDEQPSSGPLTTRGLSVVLPAHNEEQVIEQTVRRCVEILSVVAPEYEIIVVDDGSTDRTGALAEALAAENPHIRVLRNWPNRGYGGALTAGFAACANPLTFFMDADGQFDIADIGQVLQLREQGHRAVIGYRQRRRDPLLRRVNGWGWTAVVSLLYGLRVRDVDCAFKLYDTALLRAAEVEAQGAMINTEILFKLSRLGVTFVQVPVEHFPRLHGSASGASLRVIARAFRELVVLRGKLHHWQGTPPPDESAEG